MRQVTQGPLLFLCLLALPAFADTPLSLAVSYFDNNSGDASLEPLSRGLADMLITDLSNVKQLQLVEREKLNLALDELKLSKTKFIDPKNALKLGKGLAARYLLVGGYVVQADTMRLDARLFDVPASKVLFSEKVEGKREEFFALEKELTELLIKALDLKLALTEKTKVRAVDTESFNAFAKYSAGLVAKDSGDDETARRLFREALELDPNYRAAKTASERVAVMAKRVEDDLAKNFDAIRKTLDPKAPDFQDKVDGLFVLCSGQDRPDLQLRRLELLTWLAERELFPAISMGFSRTVTEANSVIVTLLQDGTQWDVIPAACEYLIVMNPKHPGEAQQCQVFLRTLEPMRKAPGSSRTPDLDPEVLKASRRLLSIYASRVKK